MGHIDVSGVSYFLADGRILLDNVSFRVGDGAKAAIIGLNGGGKTTLLNLIAGILTPESGTVSRSGELRFMRQKLGADVDDATSVEDVLASLCSHRLQEAIAKVRVLELRLMDDDSEAVQLEYAQALVDFGDAGGYDELIRWDLCCTNALGTEFEKIKYRSFLTFSGGEQKRLILEYLFQSDAEVLLLDEPDNYLDIAGKVWLEEKMVSSAKTILFVSHDRELLNKVASRFLTVEAGSVGNTVWTYVGRFSDYDDVREARFERFDELQRRWNEDRQRLIAQVTFYKQRATHNPGMATRYQAALTRLARFEKEGPPQERPRRQNVVMRLRGGRTGKKVLICEDLSIHDLTRPFDLEVHFGERIAVVGANGTGKSHFLNLLAQSRDGEQDVRDASTGLMKDRIDYQGTVRLGARVQPGLFIQNRVHPEFVGKKLIEILHRGAGLRAGTGHEKAMAALGRYELAARADEYFENLSGGEQARFQILDLELGGANLLLLDEPTDNLDLHSAEVLESALNAFEGTLLSVTHDRWFAKSFDRFLVFSNRGIVFEASEPIWE